MNTAVDLVDLAQRFEADRGRLKSVAFQLLGSLSDAEDAVQAAWMKASRSEYAAVANLTAWLTTITAREALDQLRARKRRAEQPLDDAGVGERFVAASADEQALMAESVSRALLVVLDRLPPAQRVAFVLHDVFGVPFETIADLLDRSPAAAKKLASRARGRLHPAPSGPAPQTAEHLKVVRAFLAASRGGDIDTLVKLLAPDVVRTVDPALVPADVRAEMRGGRAVAEETRRFTDRARAGAVVLIDGRPGIAIAPAGRLEALLRISFGVGNRIQVIDITGDHEQLRNAVLTLPS
ncbi:sigma-70 family RNA polymerase sigma factor [Mycobacterium paragordonae]|uniref:sigma-70 family RNA polymerase sigma factor n=1 Tax=Mycobacterium paragordonae TaxID=1389713 RepID=UPI000CC302A3|nr:sigma-70 family RNA polymerase sigma factor [Mycobacterium paragordonae]PJE21123.1 MAG: RNA polymerase subunit sigma [Mycobacterium sp.]TDK87057.1 sigma-70 family RNA polymerase sigma factor [Mycobacterium paragordonae]TDL00956.1 sigma-70 family RNA polymerase sigma factor [Mycobacterium paragordonae]